MHRLRSHSARSVNRIESDSDSDSDVIVVEPTRTLSTARSTSQSGARTGLIDLHLPSSSPSTRFAQPTLSAFALSASKRPHSQVNLSSSLAYGDDDRSKRKRPAPPLPSSLPIGVPRPPTKKRARTSTATATNAASARSQRQTTPAELLLQLTESTRGDDSMTMTAAATTKWPLAEGFRRRAPQKPKVEKAYAPSSEDRSATPTPQAVPTPRPLPLGGGVKTNPPPSSSSSPIRMSTNRVAQKRSTTPEADLPCFLLLPPPPLASSTPPLLQVPRSTPPSRPKSPLLFSTTTTAAALAQRKKRRRQDDHTSLAPSQRRIRVDPPPWARTGLSAPAPSTLSSPKSKRSKRGRSGAGSPSLSPPATGIAKPDPATLNTAEAAAAPALISALRTTDFGTLDPQRKYGFESSLLFQIEHVRLGPLSYQQGGRGKIVTTRTTAALDKKARETVPSWAKTEDGKEWEEDVLRRLGVQLAHHSSSSTFEEKARETGSFVARILGADLVRLKPVRLGRAGGTECYLVGRETPCRQVEMMGWIVDREYRERDYEHVYSVDDGTGIVPVHCAAPPSATTATGGTGSRQPFLPPLDASSSSASTIAATTLQQRQREAQRLAIERQFAPLQEAAEKWSDRTVLPAGRLVRVVGRVEEPRSLRDQGRRIAASLVELVDDVNAMSKHLFAVAELHKGVYTERVDVRKRLAVLEAAEGERKRRDREERSSAGSCASTVSSPEASKAPRVLQPTAPAQLPDLQIHLDGFMRYIKLHCSRRLVRTVRDADPTSLRSSPSPSPGPSSSSSSNSSEVHTTQVSIPFTLRELRDNYNLSIFATRLAQRKAQLELDKRLERAKRVRTLGAFERTVGAAARVGGSGSSLIEKGRAWVGGNPYFGAPNSLLGAGPPPVLSTSRGKSRRETSLERRERQRRESLDYFRESGPLYDDELDERIRKTWVSAIRKMREEGMIIEWDGGDAVEDVQLDARPSDARGRPGSPRSALRARQETTRRAPIREELPDLPIHAAQPRAKPAKTIKRETSAAASACPWGDIRLDFSSDDDEKDIKPDIPVTPKAVHSSVTRPGPFDACHWGDVKLESDDDDKLPSSPIKQTPRAQTTPRTPARPRKSSSPDEYELPPSAQMPSSCTPKPIRRSPSTRSDFSDISFVTTGSLDDDVEIEPRFQLVIASSLCAPILQIVQDLYARNVNAASVSEEGVRKVMAADSRWEAVARWSVEVEKALDMLCEQGSLQRHGQGYRPTSRW